MKKYKHITNYDRIQIEALMRAGHSIREIAEQLDKTYSTIWRELQKGKYVHRDTNWIEEERYSSDLAQEICDKNKLAHGKGLKLGKDYKFVEYIERKRIRIGSTNTLIPVSDSYLPVLMGKLCLQT